jgi:Fe2+ or Zn2+ uptake regulation protein
VEERERLIARMREQGFKLTPQRLAIIELLEKREPGKHYSAEEIYSRLKESYPM